MCAPKQLPSFSGFEVLRPTSAALCETDSALISTGCFARANRLGHVTRIVANRIIKVTRVSLLPCKRACSVRVAQSLLGSMANRA